MPTTTYVNPWHKRFDPTYGPEFYESTAEPSTYKGYLIFKKHDRHFDVVLDGVCVTQRAGMNGAKSYIDEILNRG